MAMPIEQGTDALRDAALAMLLAATQALPLLGSDGPRSEAVRANLRESIERVSHALAAVMHGCWAVDDHGTDDRECAGASPGTT